MATDGVTQNIISFGGLATPTSLPGGQLVFNGSLWQAVTPLGNAPSPRLLHAFAYDTTRRQFLLAGGRYNAGIPDYWVLSSGGWAHSGTWTTNRMASAMAHDEARQLTVLFGGIIGGTASSQTEFFNGSGWIQRPVSGSPPPARSGHALAYHAASQRIVMFGGQNGTVFFGDTWVFDGQMWTQVTSTPAPSARTGHTLTYDTTRERVVLFGGRLASGALSGATWEFDGSQWVQTSALGPSPRANHGAAYLSSGQKVVLYGGVGDGGVHLDDTWEYGR